MAVPIYLIGFLCIFRSAASKNFWWFAHSWSHSQAHNKNFTELSDDMFRNKLFAEVKLQREVLCT